MAIKEVDFGKDDAKGDADLSKYFIETPEFASVLSGKACFVIGRKGTGKTAICEKIMQDHRPDRFTKFLSFKSAPVVQLYASADAEFKAPNQYISMWKFLIVVEAAKLILKDHSIQPGYREALEEFLTSNFGNLDVASFDVVRQLNKTGFTVTLPIALGGLGLESEKDKTHTLHFGRAADALIEQLKKIRTTNSFYLLFDELDEDYQVDKTYFDLLISLFKAAYQVKQETNEHIAIRPIIVLRQDIFDQLQDHDFNKYADYTVHLSWNSELRNETPLSIRRLVNERIRVSLKLQEASGMWIAIVDETRWGGPTDTAWTYIASRSMDRPRDVIRFLKFAQQHAKGDQLVPADFDQAERPYSNWLQNEVENETFKVVPKYREALAVLTRIGKGRFSYHEWEREFRRTESLRGLDPSVVLGHLFDRSVVGNVEHDGRWLFKYKTPGLVFSPKGNFIVHYGFQRGLVIPSDHPRDRGSLRPT